MNDSFDPEPPLCNQPGCHNWAAPRRDGRPPTVCDYHRRELRRELGPPPFPSEAPPVATR